jgi:hypothetical protein
MGNLGVLGKGELLTEESEHCAVSDKVGWEKENTNMISTGAHLHWQARWSSRTSPFFE